ncbi:MAG: inositol monophosphatase [Simkania sp.]|nr:inositol monophosphatase [Simkania sp.]
MNTSTLCIAAIQAALEAGELLRRGFGTDFSIESKPEGRQNLVTEYDKAAEELILKKLKLAAPSSNFLAEESGASPGPKDSVLWIIDPLDGTVNFAHQLPFFSVSIAAVVDGVVVAGVVYQPMLKELFVAEKGKGSTCNGKRLQVTTNTSYDRALFSTGFPYNAEDNPLGCIDALSRALNSGFHIRRVGSAALDLSYVAAGRFDAYWEVSLQPWDMAAGLLIVQEAGGKVTNYFDQSIDVSEKSSLLATNGYFHPKILEIICSK